MKKQNLKKHCLLLLSILCLSGTALEMTACADAGSTAETADGTAAVTAAESVTQTETEPELLPDVPQTDMNGKTIHIFQQDWGTYKPLAITDITTTDLNGDVINDAAYNRNLEIEQLLNCTITTTIDGEYGDGGYNKVLKSIFAGDDTYTFTLLRVQQYNKLCLSDGFYELSDIPYIDLSKPWWDSKYAQAVGIMGKAYGAVSDITMNSYLLAGSVYFNKDMIRTYDLDNPYDLVSAGIWTWDALFTMADEADMDLNGDGKYTNEDQYGITYIDDSPEVLLAAAGVTFAALDNNGIPQVTLGTDENMTKILRLSDLLQDQAISYNCHARSQVASDDEAGMLVRGKTLFCLGGLYYAPEMRMMDQDFGIIPYPKYDESQEEYRIPMITVAITYASVPITNADPESTGIFMENYAYLGRREVMPALYEKLLLGKVSRDDDSAAMLDIIFNNRIFDTGMIFDFAGLRTNLRVMYHDLKEDFASSIEKNASKVQKNIEALVEEFKTLEN